MGRAASGETTGGFPESLCSRMERIIARRRGQTPGNRNGDRAGRTAFLRMIQNHSLAACRQIVGYPWTSLVWYAFTPEQRPLWIGLDRLLCVHGIQGDKADSNSSG